MIRSRHDGRGRRGKTSAGGECALRRDALRPTRVAVRWTHCDRFSTAATHPPPNRRRPRPLGDATANSARRAGRPGGGFTSRQRPECARSVSAVEWNSATSYRAELRADVFLSHMSTAKRSCEGEKQDNKTIKNQDIFERLLGVLTIGRIELPNIQRSYTVLQWSVPLPSVS